MIFLNKIDGLVWELSALKKKHLFVNNKKTAIAREIIFFKYTFFIVFRMLPIRLKNLNPIFKKNKKKKFFENKKFDIKEKRISEP